MAERPVFVPVENGRCLVREMPIAFRWHPGLAPSQKKKNVVALHEAAAAKGLSPLLEISSKSETDLGRNLSALRDQRLKDSGRLIGFNFAGTDYPLSPGTVFYDWLYVNALFPQGEQHDRLENCAGFTDIEFNPKRSLNCQARSCATFVALRKRLLLDEAVASFDRFTSLLQAAV